MAMTADAIRIRAQLTSGLQINSATGLEWVKAAVEKICGKYPQQAGTYAEQTANVTVSPSTVTLSGELLSIKNIKVENEPLPRGTKAFSLNDDDTITFNEVGNFSIEYYILPDMTSLTTTTPIPIPPQFVPCIEFYLAGKIKGRLFGQSDEDAAAFMQQFDAEIDTAYANYGKRKVKKPMPSNRRY